MRDHRRRPARSDHPHDSEFAAEVASFLNITNHPELRSSEGEVEDCLWLVLPSEEAEKQSEASPRPDLYPDLDVLRHEQARSAGDIPESRRLRAALDSVGPHHGRLRETLIELLTSRSFPSRRASDPEPDLLARRLYDTLQQHFVDGGESEDVARLHAMATLKAMARSPERYRQVLREAGLIELDDTDRVAPPDFASMDSRASREPLTADDDFPQTDPLIPEDLYLEPDEAPDEQGPPRYQAGSPVPREARKRSPSRPDALLDEEVDPDEWFFRAFRLGEEQGWHGPLG